MADNAGVVARRRPIWTHEQKFICVSTSPLRRQSAQGQIATFHGCRRPWRARLTSMSSEEDGKSKKITVKEYFATEVYRNQRLMRTSSASNKKKKNGETSSCVAVNFAVSGFLNLISRVHHKVWVVCSRLLESSRVRQFMEDSPCSSVQIRVICFHAFHLFQARRYNIRLAESSHSRYFPGASSSISRVLMGTRSRGSTTVGRRTASRNRISGTAGL